MKKIIFLLYFSLSSFVYSGFSEGMNDYKNADYRSAFLEWLPLANAEDGIAQYNIAMMYKLGKGIRRDDEVSFEWFKKSFENGVSLAKKRNDITAANIFYRFRS